MTYATLRTTATPDNASRTITITENSSENVPSNNGDGSSSGRLRLRGASRNGQKVTWDDDVVDNEGCGRKSSKICCIYHKPRKFDESSSEESSDSDSDSSGGPIRRRRKCNHDHSGEGGDADPAAPEPSHKFEPNAYERMPKSNKGKGKQKANS